MIPGEVITIITITTALTAMIITATNLETTESLGTRTENRTIKRVVLEDMVIIMMKIMVNHLKNLQARMKMTGTAIHALVSTTAQDKSVLIAAPRNLTTRHWLVRLKNGQLPQL